MVVGAFPAAKLGVLAFKQLSKPVANLIKERAKASPFFRQYICMPPAQFYNWVEVQTKMWAMNMGKPTNVPQLNETMAIDLGANLLGEVIIFSIGAGLLIFEYVRQVNKETKKEEATLQEKRELTNTINDLALHLERQNAQIRELSRTVADLDSRRWMNKIKILPDRKESHDDEPPPLKLHKLSPVTSDHHDASTRPYNVSGNYDPRDGIVFTGLNLVENEVFYRDSTDQPRRPSDGIVQDALVYLNLDVYR